MKGNRITRVLRLVTTLQSGQRYTADELADMLGMSKRTVFRDLKILKEADIPCHYDKKKRFYSMDSKVFLPPLALKNQEALSLLLLALKLRSCISLPFKDSALEAALKIENNLFGETRRYCNAALRHISVKSDFQARMDLPDNTFAQLLKAILKKRVVNIHYHPPYEHKSIVTDLSPYHLRYDDHSWWVIGKSAFHKRICTLKLGQIKELNTLDKLFIENKEFDIEDYLGRAWSMTREGRLYNIKLKFLPEVARSVAEVQWHSTQTVTFENDGSAILEFHVDGLNDITWWVLGYGDKIQVLAPRVLRKRIAKIAHNMLKNNEQE
jgi:predicted DNA-binding transcriptional regulator YafY